MKTKKDGTPRKEPERYAQHGANVSDLERRVNREEYGDYHSPDCTEGNIHVPRRTVDDDSVVAGLLRS